jgi:hypothetical protein
VQRLEVGHVLETARGILEREFADLPLDRTCIPVQTGV